MGCFYRLFSPRWKPVMSSDDYPEVEEEDKEKHPSIIKNNVDLNASELGPLGEGANVNNDLTTVTWTSDEKDIDEEKKEKKEEKEEKITEDTPLQKEEAKE